MVVVGRNKLSRLNCEYHRKVADAGKLRDLKAWPQRTKKSSIQTNHIHKQSGRLKENTKNKRLSLQRKGRIEFCEHIEVHHVVLFWGLFDSYTYIPAVVTTCSFILSSECQPDCVVVPS